MKRKTDFFFEDSFIFKAEYVTLKKITDGKR